MFDFASLLMQADVIESVGGLILAAATLVGAASAIIIAVINKRSTGRQLTENERKTIAAFELAQTGTQKATENIGEIKAIGTAFKQLALTPEQQKIADEQIAPLIEAQTERIQVANNQVDHFKKLIGVDVEENPDVPRESRTTTLKVRRDLSQADKLPAKKGDNWIWIGVAALAAGLLLMTQTKTQTAQSSYAGCGCSNK